MRTDPRPSICEWFLGGSARELDGVDTWIYLRREGAPDIKGEKPAITGFGYASVFPCPVLGGEVTALRI